MTFNRRSIKTVFISAAALLLAGSLTAVAASVLGDADTNGKVTILDVTCVQRMVAELPVGDSFSEAAADADGNGVVNITDATLIQRWLAEMEMPYAIGEPIEQTTESPTDPDGWGREIFQP